MRWLAAAVMAALFMASAAAEPVPAVRVASHDDLGQRRSIRGATIEARESDALRALRRLEEEELQPALAGTPNGALPPPPSYAALALPDVPVRWDARVVRFLDFYTGDRRGRAILGGWLRAQGRYRPLIEQALLRHHLPHALLYVAMIESGYDPLDRSFAGASGLWQFMPQAARIYGLRIDHWVDERNDPEKSTEAQMRYFADLHARFGSWHLALAAFNAGYGAVLQAVAKYNSNDYWEIARHEDGLPWETVLYVPKILAAAVVGENRAALGFGEGVEEAPLFHDAVPVSAGLTTEEAARAADVSPQEIAVRNPELRQGRTPPGESWTLKLPPGAGVRFLTRVAGVLRQRSPVGTYVVRLGDRLDGIARRYQTSAARLRRDNGITDASELREGLVLLVPGEGERRDAPARVEAAAEPTLIARGPAEVIEPGRKRLFYRVAAGDGLGEIARHFGVSEDELHRWNRLDPSARLLPGLILELWVAPETQVDEGDAAVIDPARQPAAAQVVTVGSEEFLDEVEARRGRKRVIYTARAGDTLKRVGLRFGLTEGDMERINRRPRGKALLPGEELRVYLPMTAGERTAMRRSRAPAAATAACCQVPPAAAPDPRRRTGLDEATGDDPARPLAGGGGAQPALRQPATIRLPLLADDPDPPR